MNFKSIFCDFVSSLSKPFDFLWTINFNYLFVDFLSSPTGLFGLSSNNESQQFLFWLGLFCRLRAFLVDTTNRMSWSPFHSDRFYLLRTIIFNFLCFEFVSSSSRLCRLPSLKHWPISLRSLCLYSCDELSRLCSGNLSRLFLLALDLFLQNCLLFIEAILLFVRQPLSMISLPTLFLHRRDRLDYLPSIILDGLCFVLVSHSSRPLRCSSVNNYQSSLFWLRLFLFPTIRTSITNFYRTFTALSSFSISCCADFDLFSRASMAWRWSTSIHVELDRHHLKWSIILIRYDVRNAISFTIDCLVVAHWNHWHLVYQSIPDRNSFSIFNEDSMRLNLLVVAFMSQIGLLLH